MLELTDLPDRQCARCCSHEVIDNDLERAIHNPAGQKSDREGERHAGLWRDQRSCKGGSGSNRQKVRQQHVIRGEESRAKYGKNDARVDQEQDPVVCKDSGLKGVEIPEKHHNDQHGEQRSSEYVLPACLLGLQPERLELLGNECRDQIAAAHDNLIRIYGVHHGGDSLPGRSSLLIRRLQIDDLSRRHEHSEHGAYRSSDARGNSGRKRTEQTELRCRFLILVESGCLGLSEQLLAARLHGG